jgi:hypothetical protein
MVSRCCLWCGWGVVCVCLRLRWLLCLAVWSIAPRRPFLFFLTLREV